METLPEFKHYKIFNTTANGTKVEEDEVLPYINIIFLHLSEFTMDYLQV